jgi:hypothetical protein
MKKTLSLLKQEFESSCGKTPEYLAFHRTFKREFTALLKSLGAEKIEISKPNHFDASGFFTHEDEIWWFRLEDLRWSKSELLIRIADNYKDYTGGRNQYLKFNNFERELKELLVGI